jgi:hypothetical protein
MRSQAWQQAGMIDMRMREQNKIERFRIEAGKLAITFIRRPAALKHAAINNKSQIPALYQIAGAGHFTRGAMKSQFHKPRIGFTGDLARNNYRGRDKVFLYLNATR